MASSNYKYSWAMTEIRKGTPFLQMIEGGLSPAEVKSAVIDILKPYFENYDVLSKNVPDILLPEAVMLARMSEESWALEMIEKCLATRRQAKSVNLRESLVAAVKWIPMTMRGLSVHWSQFHLERDKNDLELEEFVHDCLRIIGAIAEGSMKPYLMALLHQVRIGRSEDVEVEGLESLTLGNVVDELSRKTGYGELFAPPPWNIKVSQWRNIAQHFSVRFDGDYIVCEYGKVPYVREVRLSKEEMFEVAATVYLVYTVIKISETIYFVDNIETMKSFDILPKDIDIKPEMQVLNFSLGVASQGFEMVDFQRHTNEAVAIIRDVSDMPPDVRRFHASQFAYSLWLHSGLDYATIEYRERDGTPNLRVMITKSLCEQVERGEVAFADTASLVEMTDLKTGTVIPPKPS